MRVLWFSCTPSCYDIISKGGWIESLERIVKLYLPEVQLGIAFEHVDRKFKVEHSGVTYYPINCEYGMVKKIRNKIFSSSLDQNYGTIVYYRRMWIFPLLYI